MDSGVLKMATKSLVLLPLRGGMYFFSMWVWAAYDCFDQKGMAEATLGQLWT